MYRICGLLVQRTAKYSGLASICDDAELDLGEIRKAADSQTARRFLGPSLPGTCYRSDGTDRNLAAHFGSYLNLLNDSSTTALAVFSSREASNFVVTE